MKRYSKIIPEGTRDLLFEECDARRKVEVTLSALYKQWGYSKVITPAMEFYDVFNRESAGMPMESLYKLTDRHGRLLVMRPDNTMPIARIVATRLNKDVFPLRLYYTQSVYMQTPSLAGHSDEVAQSGIELIGAAGIRADLEVLTIAADALAQCGAPDFRIELGHAGFFQGIVNQMQVSQDVRDDIGRLIEAKNYAALNDLLDDIGDTPETRAIRRLPRLFGGVEVLEEAAQLYHGTLANQALEELETVFQALSALDMEKEFRIDLGIVNRSNYYTGIVFRGYMEGSGNMVMSGGRYNNLIGEFGQDAPAVGFGVDVDVLSQAMLQRGEVSPRRKVDRLVYGEDGCEMRALLHRKELYSIGVTSEVCVSSSLEEAKEYARSKGILVMDVVGQDGIRTMELE